MKWLIVPVLWVLAVIVALGVLWRLARGKPVIVRGRWTPRFVRMVAVVLVMCGFGEDRTEAAPVIATDKGKSKTDEDLPRNITPNVLMQWQQVQARGSEWWKFKQTFTKLTQAGKSVGNGEVESAAHLARSIPERLRGLLLADLKASQAGVPAPTVPARELLAVLDEAEGGGYIDPWLNAYLWRKSSGSLDGAERKSVIDLFARLHRNARLSNTLIAAAGRLRPIMEPPIAWRSKAGRPPKNLPPELMPGRPPQITPELMRAVKALYATAEPGTWDSQALTVLGMAKGSAPATMIRAGKGQVPQTEGMVRFGRLDLLETAPGDKPVVLQHRIFGKIELPPGRLISVWELPRFLSPQGKELMKNAIADALAGKQAAAVILEQHLPLTAPLLRDALQAAPRSEGAPRLRLILTQFDDVPLPAPTARDALPLPLPGGRGREPDELRR